MEYSIGTKIPSMPGWEIVRELGEGSYGKVFEVHKKNFDVTAKAALKLIRIPKSISDIREAMSEGMDEQSVTTYFEGIVKRFLKEIVVMSELKSHPNIVACEDYQVEPHAGTIGWDILIRMELLTPMVNYQLKHPMNEEMVKRLAMDMCEALVFCQKKGLIHRDIKPANIFVDENGRFKLGDFGVARSAEKTLGGYSKQGTEIYMAPEVYLGKPYGATVDIYSLGLVLYRLINGNRLPFYPAAPAPIEFSDRENALTARLRGEPMAPPCNASEEFAAIILKACAYESKDRYRTAAEMLEALKGLDSAAGKEAEQEEDIDMEPERRENIETDDEGSTGSVGIDWNKNKKKETKQEEKKAILNEEQDEKTEGTIGISFGSRKSSDEKKDRMKKDPENKDEKRPEQDKKKEEKKVESDKQETKSKKGLFQPKIVLAALIAVVGIAGFSKMKLEETSREKQAQVQADIVENEGYKESTQYEEIAYSESEVSADVEPVYTEPQVPIRYELVSEAVFRGQMQVNRDDLFDDDTVIIHGSAGGASATQEEFEEALQQMKTRLDVLETPYAIGYYGTSERDIAIRISPERMNFLVSDLLMNLHVILKDSGDRNGVIVKALDYQLENGRWKVTANASVYGDLEKTIANQELLDLVLTVQDFELTERGNVHIVEQTANSITADFYLDCVLGEQDPMEYEYMLELLKMMVENGGNLNYHLHATEARTIDDMAGDDWVVVDDQNLLGHNVYPIVYGHESDRNVFAEVLVACPTARLTRNSAGDLRIYLDDRTQAEWEEQDASSLSIQEYVLEQAAAVLDVLDVDQFVEGETFQIYAMDHQGWSTQYQMTFEKIDGQMKLDYVFSFDDIMDAVFEPAVRNSSYFAPLITEYTRF